MTFIQRKGKAAADYLKTAAYFHRRREQVEDAWAKYLLECLGRKERGEPEPYRYGYDDLAKHTDYFIGSQAKQYARRYQKIRLYEDDFEGLFRIKVADAALRYPAKEGGYFFDFLRTVIRNAAVDLIRSATTEKNKVNHLAKSLDKEITNDEGFETSIIQTLPDESMNTEGMALNRVLIDEMAGDSTLTEQERQLFQYLRSYPDATLQEMADEIGVRDRKQASRIKERLSKKLQKYL